MKTFYFTFGTDPEYPYCGGWVEIIADDLGKATRVFKRLFPNRQEH